METIDRLKGVIEEVSEKFDTYLTLLKVYQQESDSFKQATLKNKLLEARQAWHKAMQEFTTLVNQSSQANNS